MRAVKGQWVCPEGKTYKEIMIPVRIMCTPEQLKEIVDYSLEFYQQKAIMVTLISQEGMIFHNANI